MISVSARHKTTSIAALLLSGLLAGCATQQTADTASASGGANVDVAQARKDADLPLLGAESLTLPARQEDSQRVRWGGSIVGVQNLPGKITRIEVVSRPLKGSGRPLHNDQTAGRFYMLISEFLDPAIVTPGRDITVEGWLVARLRGKVGQTEYVYPVVEANTYTYWKKQTVRAPRHFPHGSVFSRRHDDFFWPHWGLHRPARPRR